MADLQLGESFSRFYRMQSDGAAHTITDVGFRPDKVIVWNRTGWSDTSEFVKSIWVRDMPNGDALQFRNIVDSGATGNDNTFFETTDGITVTTNAAGVDSSETTNTISVVSLANPAVITVTAHGLSDGDMIRITDVVGTVELNNNRYRVNNVTANTFVIQDPDNREDIDASNFTAWVSGGLVNQLSRVDALRDVFDAATYDITLGSAVVGDDNDILGVELFKYGQYTDLGDVA